MHRRLLAAVLVALLLILVIIPFGVAYSSLHPARCQSTMTPESLDMEYEDLAFTTQDGVELRGWLIPGDEDTLYMLLHGYTSCKADERLLKLAQALNSRGYPVMLFDFRGHGESGGTTTIGPREVLDLQAALDAAEERGYTRVVLVGYSMGATVVIVGGSGDDRVVAIVADSPYYSLDQVIPRWIGSQTPLPAAYGGLIGIYGELLAGVDTEFGPAHVDSVDKPLLVLYGAKDPLITLDEARDIASRSPCGRLYMVEEAGHVEIAEYMGLDSYVDLITGVEWEECPG